MSIEKGYESDAKWISELEERINELEMDIKQAKYNGGFIRGLYGYTSIEDIEEKLTETQLNLVQARSDLRLTVSKLVCMKLTYMPSATEYSVRLRYSAEAYLILTEAGFPHDVAWPLVALAYWVFLPDWWQRFSGDN